MAKLRSFPFKNSNSFRYFTTANAELHHFCPCEALFLSLCNPARYARHHFNLIQTLHAIPPLRFASSCQTQIYAKHPQSQP